MRDERQRLAALSAMGVTVWTPRVRAEAPPAPTSVVEKEVVAATPRSVARPVAGKPQPAPAQGQRDDIASTGLDALGEMVASCTRCVLHEQRNRSVFGVGNPDARCMLIGEGPGAEEDRQGEPFVGRAGRLLNAMLGAIGLEREEVYIANIVKCRPPQNRDPRPEEVASCAAYLSRQIELVNPRVIVALGRVAAQNLLSSTTALGRLRREHHSYPGTDVPLVVTYHPAYLLRSPKEKSKAWQDLKHIRHLLQAS